MTTKRPICCWISVCTANSTSKTAKPPQSSLLYWHHQSSIYDSFRMRLLAQTSINLLRFPPYCSETSWFVFFGGHCGTLKAPLHQIKALALAVYFLESTVPQPLTLGLLLSLLQQLTHLDTCAKDRGSERKWRWTTRYSLHATLIWSQIRSPRSVTLVMLFEAGCVHQPV